MTIPCERQDELLDALGRGYLAADLESHVAACPACGELRTVAGAVLDDRVQALAEATVPAAGTMWWRLQIRRHQEADARARRFLLTGQAATLVAALALVLALFGPEIAQGVRELAATVRLSTPILVGFAACLLLPPIAGWILLRQK